jgi:hypothetical protein
MQPLCGFSLSLMIAGVKIPNRPLALSNRILELFGYARKRSMISDALEQRRIKEAACHSGTPS